MNESRQPPDSLTVTKVFGIVALVAVIAIVAASILTPNYFSGRRETAPKNTCINNLRLIDGAKQTWALENHKSDTDIPTWTDIEPYLGRGSTDHVALKCPSGGTYTLRSVSNKPTCSIPDHVLP